MSKYVWVWVCESANTSVWVYVCECEQVSISVNKYVWVSAYVCKSMCVHVYWAQKIILGKREKEFQDD